MKNYLGRLFGIFILSTSVAFANTQDAAKIFQDKAKDYAIYYADHPNFDLKLASQELSQNAMDLAKVVNVRYTLSLNDITAEQCLDELMRLGSDSRLFIDKALAGLYKRLGVVDGNIVMLIAAGAGMLTYTVIDSGNFCHIEKSIHDSYWAANIIRLGIDGINVAFS